MDVSIIIKVVSWVMMALKECPLKKMSKNETEIAIYIAKNIKNELNPREGLNRMLTHMESAYIAYRKTMGTYNFADYERIMWGQAEILNELCLYIALVHYVLGNRKNSSLWLIENMCNKGPWRICIKDPAVLKEIGLINENYTDKEFYKEILGSDFDEFYKEIILPSDVHASNIREENEFYSQFGYISDMI